MIVSAKVLSQLFIIITIHLASALMQYLLRKKHWYLSFLSHICFGIVVKCLSGKLSLNKDSFRLKMCTINLILIFHAAKHMFVSLSYKTQIFSYSSFIDITFRSLGFTDLSFAAMFVVLLGFYCFFFNFNFIIKCSPLDSLEN